MYPSQINHTEGEHPTSQYYFVLRTQNTFGHHANFYIAGKITFVSFTSSRCNGNESRYCRQPNGQTISQNLHSET